MMLFLINILCKIQIETESHKIEPETKSFKIIFRLDEHLKDEPVIKELQSMSNQNSDRIIINKSEVEDIALNERALCILFRNMSLLNESAKLKNVYVEKIAINKNNRDPWNKIIFKDNVDITGYFRGVFTDKYDLFESMLFHPPNTDEETQEYNVINMKKILYYIGILRNTSIWKLYEEDCELEPIDLVIFKNLYVKNKPENVNVCTCRDLECTICNGIFQVKKTLLVNRVH